MSTIRAIVVAIASMHFAVPSKAMTPTPMTRAKVRDALREGHFWVFGEEVSDRRLAMAWAQVATENAQGEVVFNHNLGNVGVSVPGQDSFLNDGDRHVYRAFTTAEEGAEGYWSVVQRCPAALEAFDLGDAETAASALKACRYFEADQDVYARRLAYLYRYAARYVLKMERILLYVEPAEPKMWKHPLGSL